MTYNKTFGCQLKFVSDLIDSLARLTAEAVVNNDYYYAQHRANLYKKAKDFQDSRVWYDWKCSTYEIFVKDFYDWCEKEV